MPGSHRTLPPFSDEGLLPVGDYPLTLNELARSMLVHGRRDKGRSQQWDAVWRKTLVANLAVLVRDLWQAGIADVYVNGSFVEEKDHPNDIDGYFVCDPRAFYSGQLERDLNRISAARLWTWESRTRRPVPGYGSKLPMWAMYRVELYPHFGQGTGIVDRFGNELQFPAAFRLSRAGTPKGIVKIVR